MNINSNNNLHNDIRIKVANQIFTIKFNSPAYPIVFNLLTQQSSYHNNFFEIEDSSIEQRHFELYINLRMKGADCINSSKDIIDVCKLGKMFKEKIDIKELMNVVIAKQSNDINEEVDMMKHIDDTKDEEINEEIYKQCRDSIYMKIMTMIIDNKKETAIEMIRSIPMKSISFVMQRLFKYISMNNIKIDIEIENVILSVLCYSNSIVNNSIALLQKESESSITSFSSLVSSKLLPNIEWTINNISLSSDFYETSDAFTINNYKIKLHCKYNQNKDELSSAIEIVDVISPSNDTNPIAILTSSSIYQIEKENNKPVFNCIYPYSHIKSLIMKISNFSKTIKDNNFIIDISYDINYTYSYIISYIAEHISMYINDVNLSMLSRNTFLAIVKNRNAHTKEDDLYKCIFNYIHNRKKKLKENDINELIKEMDISTISIDCLLFIISNYSSTIKAHQSLMISTANVFNAIMTSIYSSTSTNKGKFSYDMISKLSNLFANEESNYNCVTTTNNNQNNLIITNTSFISIPTTNNTSVSNTRNNVITTVNTKPHRKTKSINIEPSASKLKLQMDIAKRKIYENKMKKRYQPKMVPSFSTHSINKKY